MTVWITADFSYTKAKEPKVANPPSMLAVALHQASTHVMIWLWHDVVPREFGDVTEKEVALLWRKFQADPTADDLAVTMMRRRVTRLWAEHVTLN